MGKNKIIFQNIGGKRWKKIQQNIGEFVSSYFAWITLDKQREIAEKLQHITEKEQKAKMLSLINRKFCRKA